MMGLTYEDITKHIQDQKGLTIEEVEAKVKEKLQKLSGLISKEGAAHIVANELGINLLENMRKEGVKIAKLATGMRGVTAIGKVMKTYDVRSFTKNEVERKVGSFLIGDETGLIRIVLWDVHHLEHLENDTIKEGTIIKLHDGYIRDNQGFKEFHLGGQGKIEINPEGVVINTVQQMPQQEREVVKKNINDLQAGDNYIGILGTIVQVFEPRFYSSCPECNKKVVNSTCAEHGAVTPKQVPILNFFFDDGTNNIRVVAFREHVTTLLGVEEGIVQQMQENIGLFEQHKQQLLGKQFELVGRVTKNEMFNRIEFSVQQVQEADPEKLATAMTDAAA